MIKVNKNIKLMAGIISIMLVACLALNGCSSNSSSSSSSSDSSSETTKLIVGFDNSYPPYGFLADDGSYTGFDIDMAKKVCEKLGWEVEFSPIDWSAKDALLDQGQINCIWNGFTIEGREGKYAFTDPYMVNRQVMIVKSDSGITDMGELAGKKVITQADSTAYDALTGDQKELSDTFASLDTIADYNNAFMQLEVGAVDAVACDLSIANYQLANNKGKFSQLADPISSDENYGVGFKNDSNGKEMAKKVTEAMRELDREGYSKELCEKYASYGMSYENWKLK